jgi:S-(hydroxymethyl)glutathione dehydrogenase / alcohol dehydrogenase
MKAAVCREFGKPLSIEEIDINSPQTGELKVKLTACAICHSDIIFMDGGWGGELPAVYGHEAAGVVVETGDGVNDLTPGDHVVVTLIRSCGHCRYCSQGKPVICDTTFHLDTEGPLKSPNGEPIKQGLRTGAFAEFVTVDASQVVVVPKSVPLDSASLLACGVITGLGAVINTAGVEAGSDVVIIGTGGVGLNSVQGAAIAGAKSITAVDISDEKLRKAKEFGATHAINGSTENVVDEVFNLTDGHGADYVFVTVGAKSAIEQAFRLLSRGGEAVIVGMPENGVMTEFDPGTFADYSQRVLGSKMGSARIAIDIPMLVDLYQQGRLKLDELITGRYALDDINEAITSVRKGEALRNVIVF